MEYNYNAGERDEYQDELDDMLLQQHMDEVAEEKSYKFDNSADMYPPKQLNANATEIQKNITAHNNRTSLSAGNSVIMRGACHSSHWRHPNAF